PPSHYGCRAAAETAGDGDVSRISDPAEFRGVAAGSVLHRAEDLAGAGNGDGEDRAGIAVGGSDDQQAFPVSVLSTGNRDGVVAHASAAGDGVAAAGLKDGLAAGAGFPAEDDHF